MHRFGLMLLAMVCCTPALSQNKSTRCEKAFEDRLETDKIINTCRQDLIAPLKQEQRTDVLETLGKVYSAQNEPDLAIQTWKEASQYVQPQRTSIQSGERWVRFQILIGQSYGQSNQPEKAELQFKQALAKAEGLYGGFSLPAGMVQDALGAHYGLLNKYDPSLKAFQRSRIVHEVRLGKLHPRTIETRLNQAVALLDMNKEDDAKAQFEALATLIRPLPEYQKSPVLAEALTFLGTLQMRTEQLPQAIDSYETALKVRTELFGKDDVRTSQSLNNLGVVLYRAGQLKKAEVALSQAYIIRKTKLGEKDALTLSSQKNLQAVIAAQQSGRQ
ncbi:MAG: tetratricopeptide repeat protein [Limnobacter sp.]|nr:tetratricopeptide repeat protein [Limnobacter sp.]